MSSASCRVVLEESALARTDEVKLVRYVNVLPVLPVPDFDTGVARYQQLFGREPDRRRWTGASNGNWQMLADGGGVQVYRGAEGAGGANVILGVEDVDAYVAEVSGRGISAEPFEVESGQFRLAVIQDPAGNTITLAQNLTPAE